MSKIGIFGWLCFHWRTWHYSMKQATNERHVKARCMKSVFLNAVGDEWGQQKIFGPYLITSQVNKCTRMNVK